MPGMMSRLDLGFGGAGRRKMERAVGLWCFVCVCRLAVGMLNRAGFQIDKLSRKRNTIMLIEALTEFGGYISRVTEGRQAAQP